MAQLVARTHGVREAGGSSPPTPTNSDILKIEKHLIAALRSVIATTKLLPTLKTLCIIKF